MTRRPARIDDTGLPDWLGYAFTGLAAVGWVQGFIDLMMQGVH